MTAPTTTPSDTPPAELYRALLDLHGHRCPMSVLGARLGWAAKLALAAEPGEWLAARFEHQTCALDGIQLTTGCTLGNNNLEVAAAGRHRLALWRQAGGLKVHAELREEALTRGREYARLREQVGGAQGSPAMEAILAELETLPTAQLVRVWTDGGEHP